MPGLLSELLLNKQQAHTFRFQPAKNRVTSTSELIPSLLLEQVKTPIINLRQKQWIIYY